ncbi:MAG: glycosyltransferase family 10 domain-containing protein [bacterium]
MEKETLKVGYIDFWPEWSKENFVQPILSKKYNVIEDNSKPDIIFHSIFNGMRGINAYPRSIPRILILAENWRPSRFDTDFSISFDPPSVTNFRLPLWQIYIMLWPEIWDGLINKKQHSDFERFTAFIVSNSSNFIRNSAFKQLSKYKHVHSYGKFMTNDLGLQKVSKGRYWRDAKEKFFNEHPHKFMMAFENTTYPYYCTEKIMDAFLSGCIPIYWGDPKVVEDWNPNAFINVNKNKEWIKTVEELDNDSQRFNEVYNESVFTEEQQEKHSKNMRNFADWLLLVVKNSK